MKSITKGKNKSSPASFRFTRKAVATASLLAVGILGVPAQAQTTTYTFTTASPSTQTSNLSLSAFIEKILNDQINSPPLLSNVANITGASSIGVSFTGPGTATPISITNNSFRAITAGNQYSSQKGLGTLATSRTLGMVSGQIQGGDAAASIGATSSVTNLSVKIALDSMPTGTMVIQNNTLSSTTQLNQADQSASGQLAAGYSTAQTGSIAASSTPAGVISSTVTSGLAMVNHQQALNAGQQAGSAATVTGNTVLLDTTNTTGNFASSATVSDNKIAAQYGANLASNIFNAQTGSAALNGTVAVSNAQANVELGVGAGAADTASVGTSSIQIDFRNRAAGVTSLTGPMVVERNQITASSTGNSATTRDADGNVAVGNAIFLGNGVDMTGTGSATANSLTIANNSLNASVGADLALFSGQGNQGTGLASTVTTGQIKVTGDGVFAAGDLTISANKVASDVTGNLAANLVQTGSANLTGSVAAGNLQVNDATSMIATTTGANISANVGNDNFSVFGTTTVNSNTISAAASGSVGQTTVQLNSTNLAVPGTTAGATANTAAFGSVVANAGATANNIQGNYGATTPITAAVTGSSVQASFRDPLTTGRESLNNASVTLNGNTISGDATGNNALTSAALGTGAASTTNASGTAAVGNNQFNGNLVSGTVGTSGVSVTAYSAFTSPVSANGNTISSSGTANVATNSLSSNVTNLTVNAPAFGAGSASVDTATGVSASGAAFSIASGQKNEAAITSGTSNTAPFVVVDVAAGAAGAGIDASNVSVNTNTAKATTTGNQVANTLSLTASNLSTAAGTAGQVASVSNYQENSLLPNAAAANVTNTGGGLMFGIKYDGIIGGNNDTNLTVSSNTASAKAIGNTATNEIGLSAQNYGSTAAAGGGGISSTVAGVSSVTNEFALVNRQVDTATSRTATTAGAVVGVSTGGFGGNITDANITASGNSTLAEARNNNASNSVMLTGVLNTNVATGAGALNQQSSSTPVTASITGARVQIQAETATAVDTSNLSITGNTTQGLAVGNSAGTAVAVTAHNLTGNSGGTGAVSVNGTTGALSASTDYGVGNVQSQTGNVNSGVSSAMILNLAGSAMSNGSATNSGNVLNSLAQSNSSSTLLALAATNVTSSGSIASHQNATGVVQATQTTQGAEGISFGMVAASTTDTPVVVGSNSILVAAGQNEAFNKVQVSGTTIAGRGFNNPSAYVPGTTIATAGTDFSAVNVQTGLGSVTATAAPGVIGTVVNAISGSSVSVTGNDVTAKATVNNAVNQVLLNGGSTLSATGVVNNAQTDTAGAGVLASVTGANVGIAQPAPAAPITLNGTIATVSGNSLNAIAGGNNATNALEATGAGSIAGSANAPTFAVLNYQSNVSAMNASVATATIGINQAAPVGGLTNTTASVSGNQVLASGYGNNSFNNLSMSVLAGTGNQSTASVTNVQANSGTVTATASAVNVGVFGGAATGSSVVVSGNTVTAQSIGNAAVNKISSK